MKKFEVGKIYSCRSIGDHNCIWRYKVLKRTAKTIVIQEDDEEPKVCRIKERTYCGQIEEFVYPEGRYSMCPILSA